MNAAGVLFLGLLWALMGGRRRQPAPARELPPTLPQPRGERTSTPPWPSVTPSGLPPFPGSGWQYDEPPPKAVQQRAGELRAQLWARGKGSHKIEQTAGRWIAYRAELTRGNKQGVVAYRERSSAAPRPPAAGTAQRPTAPSAPGMGAIVIPVATDLNAPNVYVMRPGTTYRVQSEAELPAVIDPDAVKRGLEAGGAKNVTILPTGSALTLIRYDISPTFTIPVAVGEWLTMPIMGSEFRLRFIEIKVLGAPAVSPIGMPTLRRGSKGPAVGVLQRKLGIAADDQFGAGTHAAVVAYQRRNGLKPDGVVGPNTWIALLGRAA